MKVEAGKNYRTHNGLKMMLQRAGDHFVGDEITTDPQRRRIHYDLFGVAMGEGWQNFNLIPGAIEDEKPEAVALHSDTIVDRVEKLEALPLRNMLMRIETIEEFGRNMHNRVDTLRERERTRAMADTIAGMAAKIESLTESLETHSRAIRSLQEREFNRMEREGNAKVAEVKWASRDKIFPHSDLTEFIHKMMPVWSGSSDQRRAIREDLTKMFGEGL